MIVPSFNVWKSIVTPRAVPSSSLRLYRLPIDADESSTRVETCAARSFRESLETYGAKGLLFERGAMRTLVGAIIGGNDRT